MKSIYQSLLIVCIVIISSCKAGKEHEGVKAPILPAKERTCDCAKILTRQERGFYLQYVDGEDSFYTGKCKIIRENGNEITYRYLKGHIMEEIETYPGGLLNEEMIYDSLGNFLDRKRYYPNGHVCYLVKFNTDHNYETFYENGRIQRKGGYGFTKEDRENRFSNLDAVRLYDSIWKDNGQFDSVWHYSKASITY